MAYGLGKMAVEILGPVFVIGRDTRQSGAMLEAALIAGITSAGGSVKQAGIIPTPAVALLTRELKADGGIVVSASHNPPEHNGIKFFDGQGFKLTKAMEDAFEEGLQALVSTVDQAMQNADTTLPQSITCTLIDPAVGSAVGSAEPIGEPTAISAAAERYIEFAVRLMTEQGIDLKGMKIAVDTGHGAASVTTPETLKRLGAEVTAINADFDGNNINVGCGSTKLDQLKALVKETGAEMGFAHDGDADRVLAVDAQGNEVDGDIIEAICALDLKQQGKLAHDTVVSTVMCNLGFVKAMEQNGIKVIQTAVGDSNVLAAMREGGYVIGGEQSGHMIFLEHNTTGDGLVTALQLLAAMRRSGKLLTELAAVITRYPQVLINIKVASKEGFETSQAINDAIRASEERMGDEGRVLVRASGTELLIRVMTEAKDSQTAEREAELLADAVRSELG
jgi:phosphoglucosamine mutase